MHARTQARTHARAQVLTSTSAWMRTRRTHLLGAELAQISAQAPPLRRQARRPSASSAGPRVRACTAARASLWRRARVCRCLRAGEHLSREETERLDAHLRRQNRTNHATGQSPIWDTDRTSCVLSQIGLITRQDKVLSGIQKIFVATIDTLEQEAFVVDCFET
eukprot:6174701-Pleurochrysis_carterae.AAC.1